MSFARALVRPLLAAVALASVLTLGLAHADSVQRGFGGVNSASGTWYAATLELNLLEPTWPVYLEHSYNGRDPHVGLTGRGWSTGLEWRLQDRGNGQVALTRQDGRRDVMALHFLYTTASGPSRIEDASGNAITFEYSSCRSARTGLNSRRPRSPIRLHARRTSVEVDVSDWRGPGLRLRQRPAAGARLQRRRAAVPGKREASNGLTISRKRRELTIRQDETDAR